MGLGGLEAPDTGVAGTNLGQWLYQERPNAARPKWVPRGPSGKAHKWTSSIFEDLAPGKALSPSLLYSRHI